MRFLKATGLACLLALTVGVVTSRVMAQAAARMFATLSTNLTTGASTPVTCTASGNGCALDVSISGGGGTFTSPIVLPSGSATEPAIGFSASAGSGLYWTAGNSLAFTKSNTTKWITGTTEFSFGSGYAMGWSSQTDPVNGANDTSFRRGAAGAVTVGNGDGTIAATVSGVYTTSVTPVCTTAVTTEETLWTYSLPAGTLNANGRGLKITVLGRFAVNANTKTNRLYFGSTVVNNADSTTNSGGSMRYTAYLFRTGAATQFAWGEGFFSTAVRGPWNVSPTETLSGAVTIRFSGQNGTASANDICVDAAMVESIK